MLHRLDYSILVTRCTHTISPEYSLTFLKEGVFLPDLWLNLPLRKDLLIMYMAEDTVAYHDMNDDMKISKQEMSEMLPD